MAFAIGHIGYAIRVQSWTHVVYPTRPVALATGQKPCPNEKIVIHIFYIVTLLLLFLILKKLKKKKEKKEKKKKQRTLMSSPKVANDKIYINPHSLPQSPPAFSKKKKKILHQ